MNLAYTGNGAYCYSNSLHMCLREASKDKTVIPESGFLECLTLMPFGVSYFRGSENPRIFFNSPAIDPIKGLQRALDTLGWTYEQWQSEQITDDALAIARLREAAQTYPILVGPINMSYLSYDPNANFKTDSDHFVVVYTVDDQYIRFHDPQGYPSALLPISKFIDAWKAEKIGYTHHHYTMHYHFQQQNAKSRQQMIEHTLPLAKANIAENPGKPDEYGSIEALQLFIHDFQESIPPGMIEHLIFFALPVAARRAIDAALFMQEAQKTSAATLFQQKAELLAEAQYTIVQQQLPEAVAVFQQLAQIEAQLLTAF